MCILCIVGISGFFAVLIAISRNQICATQIAIRTIKLTIQHICNKLLIAIPDVFCGFTIDSFAQPQAIHIIGIACSRFAIGKANQLIQAIVSVGFRLAISSLCNLITVGIIGVNCLFYVRIIRCQQVCRTRCQAICNNFFGSAIYGFGFFLK